MATYHGGLNVAFGDGSVRFAQGGGPAVTLQTLVQTLRLSGHGATAIALGPQGPALQATLAALRRSGVAVGLPKASSFVGALPSLLVWPNAQGAAQGAAGIGFVSAPAGPTALIPLLPAVQKVREAAARMRMKFDMRLVMVQDTAHSAPSDQYALNFTHLRD
jgi:prepilin-type processing-associated H-X9-DG protein